MPSFRITLGVSTGISFYLTRMRFPEHVPAAFNENDLDTGRQERNDAEVKKKGRKINRNKGGREREMAGAAKSVPERRSSAATRDETRLRKK